MKKKFIKLAIASMITSLWLTSCKINGVDVVDGVKQAAKAANEEVDSKYKTMATITLSDKVIEVEVDSYNPRTDGVVEVITVDGDTYLTSWNNVLIEQLKADK